MTITCSPMSRGNTKINKTFRKISTFKSRLESYNAGVAGSQPNPGGAGAAGTNQHINNTKHSVDSPDGNLNLNNIEDMIPFEAEYSLNLHEQYYELLEDKGDYYFQFVDVVNNCLLLFPRTEDSMLRWSTHFKKHCINTNLYDCFEIEQLLYHNPAFNVDSFS